VKADTLGANSDEGLWVTLNFNPTKDGSGQSGKAALILPVTGLSSNSVYLYV
jgi:hypothetical protein